MAIRTHADDLTDEIMSELNEYCRNKYQALAPPDPASSAEDPKEEGLKFYRTQAAVQFGIPDKADQIRGTSISEIQAEAESLSKPSMPKSFVYHGHADLSKQTYTQKVFEESMKEQGIITGSGLIRKDRHHD